MASKEGDAVKAVALALVTALLMSVAAALVKSLSQQLSVELILFSQYLVCLLLIVPMLVRRRLSVLKTERPGLHIVRSVLGLLCHYAYFIAIKKIPLIDAVLLRNAAPLFVPVLIFIFLRQSISPLRWIPIAVGFLGVVLVLHPDGDTISLWHFAGIASAMMLAGSILSTRLLASTENSLAILFYYFLISTLIGFPIVVISDDFLLSLEALLPLFLVGSLTLIAMWCYTEAYRYGSALLVSPLSYFGVVFAGFWGWLIWDQIPSFIAIAGTILIMAGGVGSFAFNGRSSPKNRKSVAC